MTIEGEFCLRFNSGEKETEKCKQQLLEAKHHAESVAKITEDLAEDFVEAAQFFLYYVYLRMPGTIEELEAAIQDTMSEANSILFLNRTFFKNMKVINKVDALTDKLEEDDRELKKCLSEIETLKENWLPMLRNLVAKINETFSRNFQEMAVAGEVSLAV